MTNYTFSTMEALKAFLKSNSNDKEKRYYYGDIDCMNGELYTIADISNNMDPSWFEDGGVCDVYEFEKKTFYAVLSERPNDFNIEVMESAKEAVEGAKDIWDYLTEEEKHSPKWRPHESAIVAFCYIEEQILDGYNPIWKDGEFVDPTKYGKCSSFNENSRETARIIRECMEV